MIRSLSAEADCVRVRTGAARLRRNPVHPQNFPVRKPAPRATGSSTAWRWVIDPATGNLSGGRPQANNFPGAKLRVDLGRQSEFQPQAVRVRSPSAGWRPSLALMNAPPVAYSDGHSGVQAPNRYSAPRTGARSSDPNRASLDTAAFRYRTMSTEDAACFSRRSETFPTSRRSISERPLAPATITSACRSSATSSISSAGSPARTSARQCFPAAVIRAHIRAHHRSCRFMSLLPGLPKLGAPLLAKREEFQKRTLWRKDGCHRNVCGRRQRQACSEVHPLARHISTRLWPR